MNRWAVAGIVAGALLMVCFGAGALVVAALNDDSSGGGGHSVGLNEPAGDGKFEFTVTGVECGVAQVGEDFLVEQAQGQFCLVHIEVRNTGDEARTFDAGNQRAFNADGDRYDADSSASFALPGNEDSFLEEINPGNSVSVTVVFDIPRDATLSRVELHDSVFSGGVTVNLT